ncbi:CDP-alcohol phosphatidyltransferase family protein [Hoyosella subflava]|uniref:CDP-diacylglycerol--serine O-phosphatidyltransferase n=1 Tax=Hoyosella subflava (strain DSM 45089 / JCM 17490 / NBRC 109087 / DQS3-9A1) TaxID=443218 RepID=F6EJH0_HOYSD|nr:phosphatidylcholine/phosphatidylserine synthase [Hoyosella subflava]AEF39019.1 CDP-diacylglycerol--serine O-phosphatidyltransferase [Hoyosella subflava DQS3-9A1]
MNEHDLPGEQGRPIRSAGVRLVPSAITVLAMCAGLSAIKMALDGSVGLAIALIGAAALLDGVDGRIARLLDATTRIGAELDSLADAISFGVAPAIVLYVTLLTGNNFGWVVALIFAVSIVLRLARFNTLIDDTEAPAYHKDYFVGVPAPAGGLIALAPLAAYAQWGAGWWSSFPLVVIWMVIASALIVSRIPTLAMKQVSVPPRMAVGLLISVALVAAGLVTYPYILLIAVVFLYLAHIPYAVHTKRWVAARPETWHIPPAERRALRRSNAQRRSLARLGLRRSKPRGRSSRVAGRGRAR